MNRGLAGQILLRFRLPGFGLPGSSRRFPPKHGADYLGVRFHPSG